MKEKELLANGYRKYSGKDIDVFFNTEICTHSTRCVKGNPEVFDTKRRPWLMPDEASSEEVENVINTCPSGALKYIYSGQLEALPKEPASD